MTTAVAAILAGCSATPTSTPAISPPTLSPNQPRRGGTYRIASPYDAITLDPARADGVEDSWLVGTLLFDQLYSYDATGKLLPDLAEALPMVSADGTVQTIRLRSGVRFHNGRELTADDVAFTLERALLPPTASWGVARLLDIVGADAVAAGTAKTLIGVTTPDAHTIEIHLKQPSAALASTLSLSAFGIVPRAETLAAGDAWGQMTVIGTGPFKLAEWKPGERMTLTRNDDYFRVGLPYLDGINIAFNVVGPVALERWQKGDVEFAWFGEPSNELNQAENDAALKAEMRATPNLSLGRIVFNRANKVVSDVRVRQAMAAAIDKAALAHVAGLADPATGVLSPLSPQFDTAFADPRHDPQRARQLLAAAGYPNGIDDFLIVARDASPEVNTIRAQLAEVGIRAQVLTGDPTTINERIRSGAAAMAYTITRMDTPDAYDALARDLVCDPADVRAAFQPCNDRARDLVSQAERLPIDDANRTALYRRAQDIIANQDVNEIPVLWRRAIGLGRNTAHNDALHPIYGLPTLGSAWLVQP